MPHPSKFIIVLAFFFVIQNASPLIKLYNLDDNDISNEHLFSVAEGTRLASHVSVFIRDDIN